jgi:hypothetical protein
VPPAANEALPPQHRRVTREPSWSKRRGIPTRLLLNNVDIPLPVIPVEPQFNVETPNRSWDATVPGQFTTPHAVYVGAGAAYGTSASGREAFLTLTSDANHFMIDNPELA